MEAGRAIPWSNFLLRLRGFQLLVSLGDLPVLFPEIGDGLAFFFGEQFELGFVADGEEVGIVPEPREKVSCLSRCLWIFGLEVSGQNLKCLC